MIRENLKSPENEKNKPQPASEETLEAKEYRIKKSILELNANDKENEYLDSHIKKLLDTIDVELTALELASKPLYDEELHTLRMMYDDLRKDFDEHKSLVLDKSFDDIVIMLKKEIWKSGVHKESINSGYLAETIEKLRSCGIEPDYIMTKGDPKAPTVVFFMQRHGIGSDSADSQDKIFMAIKNAAGYGLVRDVYEEGLGYEWRVDPDRAADVAYDKSQPTNIRASVRAAAFVRDIRVIGMEDDPILDQSMKILDTALKGLYKKKEDGALRHRGGAQNIFMAHNVKEGMKESKQALTFVILGGAHEKYKKHKIIEKGIPFSKILAYYGLNVVVVDTTKLDKVY